MPFILSERCKLFRPDPVGLLPVNLLYLAIVPSARLQPTSHCSPVELDPATAHDHLQFVYRQLAGSTRNSSPSLSLQRRPAVSEITRLTGQGPGERFKSRAK